MSRLLIFLLLVLLLAIALRPGDTATKPEPAACAGPPLASAEARNEALEAGYEIDPRHGCISKASFEAVNAARAEWERNRAVTIHRERVQLARAGEADLVRARHGFRTALAGPAPAPLPLPSPPAAAFVRSDYRNADNQMLAGYITPDPKDGRRHPAIIWLGGGDTNSLVDFWTPGPPANDQSAHAFGEAGVVMMFPTLRGGNGQRGAREHFLGEVDDVLAAARQLARIAYVDPQRIYLGGHSTGATLALLVAATGSHFRAVFAFGPVARVERYPASLFGVDWATLDAAERRLRSPIEWLAGIGQPAYVIEGTDSGNAADLAELCAASRNPLLRCVPVPGEDHFSVLARLTPMLAARIITDRPAAQLVDAGELASPPAAALGYPASLPPR